MTLPHFRFSWVRIIVKLHTSLVKPEMAYWAPAPGFANCKSEAWAFSSPEKACSCGCFWAWEAKPSFLTWLSSIWADYLENTAYSLLVHASICELKEYVSSNSIDNCWNLDGGRQKQKSMKV